MDSPQMDLHYVTSQSVYCDRYAFCYLYIYKERKRERSSGPTRDPTVSPKKC